MFQEDETCFREMKHVSDEMKHVSGELKHLTATDHVEMKRSTLKQGFPERKQLVRGIPVKGTLERKGK